MTWLRMVVLYLIGDALGAMLWGAVSVGLVTEWVRQWL